MQRVQTLSLLLLLYSCGGASLDPQEPDLLEPTLQDGGEIEQPFDLSGGRRQDGGPSEDLSQQLQDLPQQAQDLEGLERDLSPPDLAVFEDLSSRDLVSEELESIYAPEAYPSGVIHSPITPFVRDRLRTIAALEGDQREEVFMKVGASSTVNTNTLHCFAQEGIDLGAHEALRGTLEFFLQGEAQGRSPFNRNSLAAEVGRNARWAITGNPSPIEREIAAIHPRFALVHYGTNDMGYGTTYASALANFYDNMMRLTGRLVEQGILPILIGISHRQDNAEADLWVPSFNAVLRGMAQARQIPFIDLHLAFEGLPRYGLARDGIHPNRHSDGACRLDEEGLNYGYNLRNLIVLEALQRAWQAIFSEEPQDQAARPTREGPPFEIRELPFADFRDTRDSEDSSRSLYSGCQSESDESGPEYLYIYEPQEPVHIRAMVFDQGEVDIDLHLLDESASEAGCIRRHDRIIEARLGPGRYYFALDSWSHAQEGPRAGPYLFVLTECLGCP